MLVAIAELRDPRIAFVGFAVCCAGICGLDWGDAAVVAMTLGTVTEATIACGVSATGGSQAPCQLSAQLSQAESRLRICGGKASTGA